MATTADLPLLGKTAVVTGATGGIGEECAAQLAGLGATVVLAVRSSRKAAETLDRIRSKLPEADVVEGPPLDMANPESIRAFAAEYEQSGRPLHLLINNAGALTFTNSYNSRGVPELCQVNHLGPYLLTRLLERVLVRSAPSRVVNVSSCTHCYGVIGDPWYDFLLGPQGHFYENTKLANVLFSYELQRRLGRYGVQACAVDPGAVRTDIWRSRPLMRAVTGFFWAPPSVGARALVVAATEDWGGNGSAVQQNSREQGVQQSGGQDAEQDGGQDGEQSGGQSVEQRHGKAPDSPLQGAGAQADAPAAAQECELRFYAPEAFATRITSWYSPEGNSGWLGRQLLRLGFHASSLWGAAKQSAIVGLLFLVAGADWPIRQLTGGALLSGIVREPSAPLSYDTRLARELWNASADVAGVPREPQI